MERFITGETGSSKSSYSFLLAAEALAYGRRPVVTNAAIRWEPWVDGGGVPRIGARRLLELMYPWADVEEWKSRLFILPNTKETLLAPFAESKALKRKISGFDAVRWFFCVRPKDGKLVWWDDCLVSFGSEKDGRPLLHFSMPEGAPGCWYNIQEAHEFLGSEEWKDLEKPHRSWASANRGAGDECYLETQVPSLVAKPLRKLAVECIHLTNHGKLNLMHAVRQPDWISEKVYKSVDWRQSDPILRHRRINRVKRMREGFDSAAKVAMAGGQADFGERSKGLPWWTLPIGAVAGVVLGCWLALHAWQFFLYMARGHGLAAAHTVKPSIMSTNLVMRKFEPIRSHFTAVTNSPVHARNVSIIEPAPPQVTGHFSGSAGTSVTFSDGRIYLARSYSDDGWDALVDGKPFRLALPGWKGKEVKLNDEDSKSMESDSPRGKLSGSDSAKRRRSDVLNEHSLERSHDTGR